jgi:ribonuclease J
VEVGLQRRLRRELQVEPLIVCLVHPAPAGTPAYKGQADSEPDTRPAPRQRRDGGGDASRDVTRTVSRAPVPVADAAPSARAAAQPAAELEPAGRARRRRSAAG